MGQDVRHLKPSAPPPFRRETVGFIFQQYNLLPSLTAAENAAIPLVIRGERLDRAAGKAGAVLGGLGMGAHADRLPKHLSGGQMQRAPIAGTVLRVTARPGEYALPRAAGPLILFGDLPVLHMRVQVDETDAPRLLASGSSVAFLRGNGARSAALAFVRIEPLARSGP